MQLQVYLEGELKDTVELTGEKLTIGRAVENRLVLFGPRVLPHHAEVSLGPDGPLLADLGSERGTLVNDEPVLANAPHRLVDGAVIRIGLYVLVYHADSDARNEQPPAVTIVAPVATAEVAAELFAPAAPPRPTVPIPPAAGPVSRYREELPPLYHGSDFLRRYLLIPETIWEPMEQRQDFIAAYFDPRTCPEPFIAWIASWMDLNIAPIWSESRRRRLLASAFEIARWRGTPYGLGLLIEACTGLEPVISNEPGERFVFRVQLKLPRDRAAEHTLIEELISTHKPAHVAYRLEIELVEPPVAGAM